MSGIAGYAGRTPPDARTLRAMCDALVHRGPDHDGYFLAEGVAFGMRQLAVIDVAGGNQPIHNEDRTLAVVADGRIYNFAELRTDLQARGHTFATAGDIECIAHLYEEYGTRCVEYLRGMFAFALWDSAQQRLLLARDRPGAKPLLYRATPDGIWFASELKALMLDETMPRAVDPLALHSYLTYGYVPAPQSIVAGVRKLPAAHTLSWHKGIAEEHRYWRLDYEPKQEVSEPTAVETARYLIREATRIRLVSERRVGVFLSGGLDSALVVAAMAEESREPVRTFSIGFEESHADERFFARLVADRFSTRHEEIVAAPDIVELMRRLTWHYDEPFADFSAIPTFCLAEMAGRHVVVALNGDGADESFGGYGRYVAQRLAARIRVGEPLAKVGRRAVAVFPSGQERSSLGRAKRFLKFSLTPPATRYAEVISSFTAADKQELYSDEMHEAIGGLDATDLLIGVFSDSDAIDPADAAMDVDVQTYLPGELLVKTDIATMAHSLEARSPFLDHKLMEFAARLPADMKIRGRTSKWLLKQAGRSWVPDAVIDRPKMGLRVPVAAWLRNELRDLVHDALTDVTARTRPYFEPATIDRLIDEHEAGTDHSRQLWTLLCFELWHRTFVDHRAVPPVWEP